MSRLSNMVCVVTGAATGLGEACARALALTGAKVALVDLDAKALQAVKAQLPESCATTSVVCDVSKPDQVQAAHREIVNTLGDVSVLVNCAGVNLAARHFDALTSEVWEKVVDVNLNGTFHWCHAVIPGMRAKRSGTIINVSSWAGRYAAFFTGPAYNASKRAVLALTESINLEEGIHNIRSTALVPEAMATSMIRRSPVRPSDEELDRMLQPEDVADLVSYIVDLPQHVCINEVVVSPTFNRSLLGGYETALHRKPT